MTSLLFRAASRQSHTSRIAVLLLGPALMVSLAGCVTSEPLPNPPPSGASETTEPATVLCTPDNSTITWGAAIDGEPVLQSVTVSTVAADGTETVTFTPRELLPVFTGDELITMTGNDTAAVEDWEEALVTDVRRTGQVPEDFGETFVGEDFVSTPVIENRVAGTVLLTLTSSILSLPFSIDCGSGQTWEGTLAATDNFEKTSTVYECGFEPPGPAASYFKAIAYCPAP